MKKPSDLVKKLKKVPLKIMVTRNEPPLLGLLIAFSYNCFQKVTGIKWRIKDTLILGTGEIFHNSHNTERLAVIFKRGGFAILNRFKRAFITRIGYLDKLAKRLAKLNPTNFPQKRLSELIENFIENTLYGCSFLTPTVVAGKVIENKIFQLLPSRDDEEKQKWLYLLSFPDRENFHIQEEVDFYRLVVAKQQKKPSFKNLLVRHVEKYGWIGAREYWWQNAWTDSVVKDRVSSFIKQGKSAKDELEHLRSLCRHQRSQMLKILSGFPKSSKQKLKSWIALSKEFAYLRTWRTDVLYRSGFLVRQLFYEAAKRAGLKNIDIPYLVFPEVKRMARTGKAPVSAAEIARRKKYCTVLKLDNEFFVLSGVSWAKRLDFLRTKPTEKVVKGAIAFSGRVNGKARIVLREPDIKKVKPGDILVAVMTFPNFIQAMEKASAFVTDEGGILCHAAIISREMRKPCIIGTKIATQIFKDGDTVEVDANKGIVRKIK